MDVPERRRVEPGSGPPRALERSWTWLGIGFIVCLLASASLFQNVLRKGVASSGMVSSRSPLAAGDVIFEAWLVSRNAYTLSREPLALFDTPHCFPAEKTLAYGIPMITMGLLAIPVSLFTPSPALAYNFATLMIWLFSALAMYLLVKEWTGIPAAGVIAGVLYAFNPMKMGNNIIHPSVWDSCWTVFALYFSQRLFAYGRWRDACGLAGACSLQMAASFYPFVASALLAPFYAVWLLHRYRLRKVRVGQLLVVVAVTCTTAVICFGPYLEARSSGGIPPRSFHFFARWLWFAPGQIHFLGWATILLGILGLLIPRKTAAPRLAGDARWMLLLGASFVTIVSMGPYNNGPVRMLFGPEPPMRVPDIYSMLAVVVPGLDSIRVVARLVVALQIAICIFAGLGAAWLIRLAGRRGPIVAGVLLLFATLTTLGPHRPPAATNLEVEASEVKFFEDLAALGNSGPIVELPLRTGIVRTVTSPRQIMATRYHQRRTWTCYGSYHPEGRDETNEIIEQLPDPEAQRALRELGFSTVILRHKNPPGLRLKTKMERDGRTAPRVLLSTKTMTAYELRSRGGR